MVTGDSAAVPGAVTQVIDPTVPHLPRAVRASTAHGSVPSTFTGRARVGTASTESSSVSTDPPIGGTVEVGPVDSLVVDDLAVEAVDEDDDPVEPDEVPSPPATPRTHSTATSAAAPAARVLTERSRPPRWWRAPSAACGRGGPRTQPGCGGSPCGGSPTSTTTRPCRGRRAGPGAHPRAQRRARARTRVSARCAGTRDRPRAATGSPS